MEYTSHNPDLESHKAITPDDGEKCSSGGNSVSDEKSEDGMTDSEVLYQFEQAEKGNPIAQFGL